jgi:Ca2+-binding EF-hand superfamily protein
VRFHPDRSVSFEDDQPLDDVEALDVVTAQRRTSQSRSSGLSSPTIDPAFSPPRSRSRSPGHGRIHFDEDTVTIETITEAAARLRTSEQQDARSSSNNAGAAAGCQHNLDHHAQEGDSASVVVVGDASRMVHFSAMRDVTVIRNSSDDAASALFQTIAGTATATDGSSGTNNGGDDGGSHHAVRFADDTQDAVTRTTLPTPSSENDMAAAAERLRRLIRRAEEVDHVTLEAAFEHFDQDHSGGITPDDLQRGLRSLGSTFFFTLEECRALLDCLAGRYAHHNRCGQDGDDAEPRVTLLGFYRAMGRRSPPPEFDDDHEGMPDDQAEVSHSSSASPASRALRRSSSSSLRQRSSTALASSSVVHAQDAANRLRRMVLDAEQNEDVSLETFFNLLDVNHTGHISPADFRRGLQELGLRRSAALISDGNAESVDGVEPAFASISEQDCEQLVALFDINHDGLVSLLDFYRFMGQRSPPLSRTASDDER